MLADKIRLRVTVPVQTGWRSGRRASQTVSSTTNWRETISPWVFFFLLLLRLKKENDLLQAAAAAAAAMLKGRYCIKCIVRASRYQMSDVMITEALNINLREEKKTQRKTKYDKHSTGRKKNVNWSRVKLICIAALWLPARWNP